MRILVIGAGAIGFQLCKQLAQHDHDIILVELDPRRARRAGEQLDALVVPGNGTSVRTLRSARIEQTDVVAAMTTNEEANLLACRLAKTLGAKSTIARVRNPEYTLPDYPLSNEELGVDLIIHPERETADAIVRLIRQSSATDIIEFENGKVQLLGIRLEEDSRLLHTPLAELWQRNNYPPVRIVAIQRKQQTVIPRGPDVLVAGDQIYAVCDPTYMPEFIAAAGKKDTIIADVMILGGGLVGQFVASSLTPKVNVKLIESRVEKSWEIADRLPETLIIQGDGMDYDLLASEGILEMDAFVSVTGDDETNIIATLMARHLEVPRAVALVNRIDYLPITPTIGLDAVISKQLLTVNAVQRHIHHQEVVSMATLPGVDAHCIEYRVLENSKITKKQLSEFKIPRHSLIGALLRDDQLIIPTGTTHLKPGDKAVVFTLPQALADVEKLFTS